ncbi:LysR family transcriptional regulator [Hydrogenophaga palleronii]|uniref:LysR family transcriptional regulator n=1 Tax=Hydrogenophaga palleronii TaxID=65655 RepID=UPI0008240A9A|nr:LysR family transcriptional regulator [Hydrogenophaga palleronii]
MYFIDDGLLTYRRRRTTIAESATHDKPKPLTMRASPDKLDLNLLRVLVQIHEDRKVSLAAEHLGISQPAASSALKRLREELGDKLFSPTAHGMEPTPVATQMMPQIKEALLNIGMAMSRSDAFDVASGPRQFTIAMTEIGELHFLPILMKAAKSICPMLRIATIRNTDSNLRFDLEQGKVDLAIGHLPFLPLDFQRRLLFTQNHACLFRRGHRLDVEVPRLQDYSAAEHAVVWSAGSEYSHIEEEIDRACEGRRIGLRIPHFSALPDVLECSDLVATVPEAFARRSTRRFNLSYRAHPVGLAPLEICMFWNKKHRNDSANLWLQSLVVDQFRAVGNAQSL